MKKLSLPRIALALVGSAILAFGLCHIHAHAEVTEGGVLGAALLLDRMLGISPAISTAVITALCYLLGLRVLGREFLVYSAFAAGGFSIFYALFDLLPPFLAELAAYPLFSATVGAVFVGIGCGLAVRAGGAPTGDDALAMALSHRLGIDIRFLYLLSDLTVLGLSLFYIPLSKILWSLLTVILSGQVVGILQKIGRRKVDEPPTSVV